MALANLHEINYDQENCFHRRYVDELWLFGDKISAIPKTDGTKRDLRQLDNSIYEK